MSWIEELRSAVSSETGGSHARRAACKKAGVHQKGNFPDDSESERMCRDCEAWKPFSDFAKDSKDKHGLQKYCRQCLKLRRQGHENDVTHFFTEMIRSAKQHSMKRKGDAGNPPQWNGIDDFLPWALQQLESQGFRCAVSDCNITNPKELSLERIDVKKAYAAENCVFILRYFQSFGPHCVDGMACQWTREKFLAVPSLRIKHVDYEHEVRLARNYTPSGNADRAFKIKGRRVGGEWVSCNSQGELAKKFGVDQGQISRKSQKAHTFQIKDVEVEIVNTKECQKLEDAPLLYMAYKSFARHMDHRTEAKNKKRKQRGDDEMDTPEISFDYFVNVYERQGGRCLYTGVPLCLAKKCDWMISLERVDDAVGYIPKNVALVCHEVNFVVKGYQKWSAEVAERFWSI